MTQREPTLNGSLLNMKANNNSLFRENNNNDLLANR